MKKIIYNRKCDSCGRLAKYSVKGYDSFYEYLCEKCFQRWQEEHDDSWDDEF